MKTNVDRVAFTENVSFPINLRYAIYKHKMPKFDSASHSLIKTFCLSVVSIDPVFNLSFRTH